MNTLPRAVVTTPNLAELKKHLDSALRNRVALLGLSYAWGP